MYMKLSVVVLSIASLIVWSKLTYSASPSSNGKQELRDLAVLLHNRIVGVPAQGDTLQEMIALLQAGKAQEAALLATEHPFFYDLKLRALFTPWSNREGSVSSPLNDMVMTMIGMVRDDQPFNKVLSADIFYTVRDDGCQENSEQCDASAQTTDVARSSLKDALQQTKQSEKLHEDASMHDIISGVLSTNAFAAAFYSAGTNRRATAFVLKNFLCHEMEQLHDTETPKHWVRQDVSRSPGGDPELFNQRCVGCHAGMDALSGWSVFYDSPIPGERKVRDKITKNVLYTGSQVRDYRTPANANDSFSNLWAEGKNAKLGWRGKTSGKGAKEFGEMMTRSKAFASCMARQVYESVCYLTPQAGLAKQKSEQLAEQFEKNNYNMRKLFAATAVACLTKKKAKKTQAVEE